MLSVRHSGNGVAVCTRKRLVFSKRLTFEAYNTNFVSLQDFRSLTASRWLSVVEITNIYQKKCPILLKCRTFEFIAKFAVLIAILYRFE